MSFRVIENTDKGDFEREVSGMLNDGWKPLSSVSIAKYNSFKNQHMMGPAYLEPTVITVYSIGMTK